MADRVLNKRHTKSYVSSQNNTQVRRRAVRKKDTRVIKGMDYTFLVTVVILLCFGVVMVLSSSSVAGSEKYGDSYHFFKSQLRWSVVGLGLMLFFSVVDYKFWKRVSGIGIGLAITALVLVLTPLGSSFNGAQRWLFGFQPSELVKPAIAIFFAAMIENKKGQLTKFKDLVLFGVILIAIVVLMMKQPHLSGTIVICGIAAVVLIVGGLHPKWTMLGGTVAAVFITAAMIFLPNKRARFISFLNPFADAQNMGWQVVQSIYAIVTGSFWGLGLGQSRQKYYLPEPYNDFIFSIICEELGTFGALLVMGMFIWFIIRGIKIALEAPDMFSTLLVMGIISQVAIQALLNIAVATSSVPNTGVSLPFFSYGGTAIVILLIEMGIVLNVSRYSRKRDAM